MNSENPNNLRKNGITEVLKRHSFHTSDYQRPFAWKKEHVEEYFTDITKSFSETMERQGLGEYFLGLIILADSKDEPEYRDIVDGQQRLVTTWLFHAVLFTCLYEIAADEGTRESIRRRRKELLKNTNGYPRIKPLDTHFYELLKEIAEAESIDKINRIDRKLNGQDEGYIRPRLKKEADDASFETVLDVWFFLYGKVTAFIEYLSKTKSTQEGALNDLLEYLSQVMVIELIVPAEQALTIFATLNARGVDLSTMDLVRAELIKHIDQSKYDHQRQKIETTWNIITQMEKGKEGSAEDFFRMFFAQSGTLVNKRKLLYVWHKHIEDGINVDEICDAFNRLLKILSFWDQKNNKKDARDLGISDETIGELVLERLRTLDKLGCKLVKPVFLAVVNAKEKSNRFAGDELLKILDDLITVYVRYLLMGRGSANTLEQQGVKIAEAIAAEGSRITKAEEIKNLWKTLMTGKDAIPDNDRFRKHVGEFEPKDKNKVKNLLILMESRLERRGDVSYNLEKTTFEVEHIFPEQPDDIGETILEISKNLTD
jgi:uncharacterized protein with ParB-like and HNH nuclease domain